LLLCISVLFTSCISTQDLIYLQKKNGSEIENSISLVASKPYRLQTNDVLSISIKAIDPKLVAIFSTTNGG
jgi:polysaccharide export outer membrane protein